MQGTCSGIAKVYLGLDGGVEETNLSILSIRDMAVLFH